MLMPTRVPSSSAIRNKISIRSSKSSSIVKLATRRLIDASATLPAADRALLSLWTQRGLDNAAMAQMTGLDLATIVKRRARIVTELSEELGLPPEDVSNALTAIADSAARALAGDELPHRDGPPAGIDPADPVLAAVAAPAVRSSASSSEVGSQAQVDPGRRTSDPRLEPEVEETGPRSRPRPVLWLATALLGIAVIAIVVITAASRGGISRPARSAGLPSAAPTAGNMASGPAARTFAPLPGGIAGAKGSAILAAGSAGTKRLLVHVTGLPAPAGSDHYEVWLYNSIIDSVPLGRLRANGKSSFTLPTMVTRYASIDISRQPRGMTEPSGASVLRAANPLAASPH